MSSGRTILGMFAHPDDEILGPGGTFAHYAAKGDRVELLCTTRGEAGEISNASLATPDNLASVREAELRCAANTIGIQGVTMLDYRDSGMAGTEANAHPNAYMNAPADEVVPLLVEVIRRVRPQIIITFEPYGGYGHPDHIAINQHTHQALDAAASKDYRPDLGSAWETERLYYDILPLSHFAEMKRRMQALQMDVGFFDQLAERVEKGWPDDQVHCVLDISASIDVKWAAFNCHRTQFGPGNIFRRLPDSDMKEIFSREYFVLVRPKPEPGLVLKDLFAPLPLRSTNGA